MSVLRRATNSQADRRERAAKTVGRLRESRLPGEAVRDRINCEVGVVDLEQSFGMNQKRS